MKSKTIQPNQHAILENSPPEGTHEYKNLSGILISNEIFERETDLVFAASLSTINDQNILFISTINITDHPITLHRRTEVARFSLFTTEQADQLIKIDLELIALAKFREKEKEIPEINQLIQNRERREKIQPPRPPADHESLWFPTPKTCDHPKMLRPIQFEIYKILQELRKMEISDPTHHR